jgi:hypothetical protein
LPKRDITAVEGGGTPVPFMDATLLAVNANKSIELTINGRKAHFRLSSSPVFIGPDGIVTEAAAIKRGGIVQVHFMQENNETLIDRVIVRP